MTIIITRESDSIFSAKSDTGYWSDGRPIEERLAFSASGTLCNSMAQQIDRAAGKRYILVALFAIKRPSIVDGARNLEIGQSATFEV